MLVSITLSILWQPRGDSSETLFYRGIILKKQTSARIWKRITQIFNKNVYEQKRTIYHYKRIYKATTDEKRDAEKG